MVALAIENNTVDRIRFSLFGIRSDRDIDSGVADYAVCFISGRLLFIGSPDSSPNHDDSLFSRTRREL